MQLSDRAVVLSSLTQLIFEPQLDIWANEKLKTRRERDCVHPKFAVLVPF